jgi:hypothetical protein
MSAAVANAIAGVAIFSIAPSVPSVASSGADPTVFVPLAPPFQVISPSRIPDRSQTKWTSELYGSPQFGIVEACHTLLRFPLHVVWGINGKHTGPKASVFSYKFTARHRRIAAVTPPMKDGLLAAVKLVRHGSTSWCCIAPIIYRRVELNG